MNLNILSGADALSHACGESFRAEWQRLYESCAWATVFQSPDFALVWYEVYASEFSPLIIVARDDQDELTGLLTLATSVATNDLVAAGSHQAEYQVWLARAEDGSAFIVAALDALRTRFPKGAFTFTYLPPKTPLDWLPLHPVWSAQHERKEIPRPLMEVGDGSSFTKALKKTHNRVHFNRLKRQGAVEFKRLETVEELEAIFDELITYANFRLGARYNYNELPHDPHKKTFYLEQMRRPKLLHVTTLRVGGQLAAAHIASHNRDEVRSGMVVTSPFFAKSSPSSLHMFMLGEQLAREGTATFDLTPYGLYKDRYATHHDSVTLLKIFFNRAAYLQQQSKTAFRLKLKTALGRIGIDPKRLEQTVARTRRKMNLVRPAQLPSTLARIAQSRINDTRELRVYTYDLERARRLASTPAINKNCIEDLLLYHPAESWQPVESEFLGQAWSNIEAGQHVYTYADAGELQHWGWLIPQQRKSILDEVGQTLYLPANSVVLSSYQTQPAARGKGLYRTSLTQMIRDAAEIPGVEHIFIYVLANNAPSRHVIEKVGFDYRFSFFQKTFWGKTRHWTNAPAEFTREPLKEDTPQAKKEKKVQKEAEKEAQPSAQRRGRNDERPTSQPSNSIDESVDESRKRGKSNGSEDAVANPRSHVVAETTPSSRNQGSTTGS
jgi:CelD/BcsL family acetyltransferase involved in cellulose biosynthesis/RimJ/RimL family protein N-acetyltransferase